MFNLSPNIHAIMTFSADSILSIILLWYVIGDIRRRALVVSYVRLVLVFLSIFISDWSHLVAVSFALGIGSGNLDSTVTLLSRASGRAFGPQVAAPATFCAALVSGMFYRLFQLDPVNVFRLLPFVHLVWLTFLTMLLESSVIQNFLGVASEAWPSIIQFMGHLILAVLQLVVVCCLVDLVALLRERDSAKRDSEDI